MDSFEILADGPDANVVTDPLARARIWAQGKPWKIRHVRSGIVMIFCPSGQFSMGSPAGAWGADADEVRHARDVRTGFYLSQTAVTQAQWMEVTGSNPSEFTRGADHPVERVSWDDCVKFAHHAGDALRLPSEAEWEYACRAGTTTAYSFGNSVTAEQVCFGKPDGTVRCGALPPNPWGFHEMHGNVWEWCSDVYGEYPADGGDERAAQGLIGRPRVIRGGGWLSRSVACRSARRCGTAPGNASNGVGFRVARTADL